MSIRERLRLKYPPQIIRVMGYEAFSEVKELAWDRGEGLRQTSVRIGLYL